MLTDITKRDADLSAITSKNYMDIMMGLIAERNRAGTFQLLFLYDAKINEIANQWIASTQTRIPRMLLNE